jgi:hypothetical protein
MSAQTTYNQSPAIGFAGMIAQNFVSPKQIDSGLVEDTYQTATLTFDADLVSLNSVAITVDGSAIAGSPVVFDTSHAATMALIVTALEAESTVLSATLSAARVITIVYSDYTTHTAAATVTLGASQAGVTFATTVPASTSLALGAPVLNGTLDNQYKTAYVDSTPVGVAIYVSGSEQAANGTVQYDNYGQFPVMKKGRFFGVAGSAVAKGASLSYHVANGKYVADGAGTTNSFVTAVTSADADGDIIVLEIDKV